MAGGEFLPLVVERPARILRKALEMNVFVLCEVLSDNNTNLLIARITRSFP
jgi:hypothetical protein